MKGVYYSTPIDFTAIMDEKMAETISIDQSIRQHLFMLTITPLGRCKFDDTFGTAVFEIDFDLPKSDNSIKEFMRKAITKSVIKYERRLLLEDIEVSVRNIDIGITGTKRVKKNVAISIRGVIIETERSFFFRVHFL
ncbi:GPW/gp25 family protein [Chryseobacterium sp. 1B4]